VSREQDNVAFTLAGPVPLIPALAEPPPPAPSEATTLIIEAGVIPRRVRRPLDLARFALAVAITGGAVFLAWFATGTATGLEQDLDSSVALLPPAAVLVLNIVGGIGTLGLPVAVSISLLVRSRVRQLFDALVALLLAVVALTAIGYAVPLVSDPRLLIALAGSTNPQSGATAPVLGGLLAFLTVARVMGRRPWNVLSMIVIGSLVTVTILSGGIAIAGVGVSLALGWALGLITRYAVGTPTTRPSGMQIAQALDAGGFPITELRAQESTARGRRYMARTRSGDRLTVTVLDRDLEGAGLASAFWTSLRLRDDSNAGAFNMRKSLDHAALVAYASEAAGVPVPRLLLTSEIGPDSCLLAYHFVEGETFDRVGEFTDSELESVWRAVRTLHEHQIAHRSLDAAHLLRANDGSVWLLGGRSGAVASSDVARRIDLSMLLCTLAMLTSVDRAIASGVKVMGVDGLARALATLQPVALGGPTRRALRKYKGLLIQLRDALVEMRPGSDVEQIQLERVRPRTLIMIVLGSIAGYVLLSQLAQVDLAALVANAEWSWLGLGLLLSLVTYVGAAWSLSGFVPERLKLSRTVQAQVAGDFATLVSPPTLGAIAINVRYLQKSGLHPALAAASVGVSQVMAFVVHIVLLLGFGIAAGTQADFTFDPPRAAVIGVAAVAVLALALLAVPAVRRLITSQVGPLLREVGPRLVTVAQRPFKLLEGIGGMLLLNLAYIGVLVACVEAFGGSMNTAVVAVVYLAGATIGQAAPTPGGLGAVEAALAAGLTAAGLDAGVAVSSVLLYRLITFWLPTLPGYWAFTNLTRKGLL
jgi:uncharacterized membrane protein YbhN (UPF0104 family)